MPVSGSSRSFNNNSVSQMSRDQNIEGRNIGAYNAQKANNTVKETEMTGQSGRFNNISNYVSYLSRTYDYFGRSALVNGVPTTVSVSGAFLNKCMEDPEKADYLERNLNAITDSISYAKNHSLGTIVNASYHVDTDGNISMMSTVTNDPDGKIAEENKEKAIKEKEELEKRLKESREKQDEITEVLLESWKEPLDLYT